MGDLMRTVRLRRVVAHGEALVTLFLPAEFDAEPGQFVTLWLPGVDEKPFAVSWATADELGITVKAVGPFTRRLLDARPGDWVGLRGPFGNRFSRRAGSLLIGGGIGNAPLQFLAQHLSEAGLPFRWIAGGRTAADLECCDQAVGPHERFTEDGSTGRQGLVTVGLEEAASGVDTTPPALVCASGPEPMLLAVRGFAAPRGIPVELSFERYMKCGIGLCGQCCLDGTGLRLCVEGPILTEATMAGVTEFGLPHRGPSGRRPKAGSRGNVTGSPPVTPP